MSYIFERWIPFLAHLSRRLIVYQSLWHPSVIRPSTISNIFSSETTGPIELKFHMETPLDRGTKNCSNGSGHMTKMAAIAIYGKNPLKIFYSRTRRAMTSGLDMKDWGCGAYQVYSNNDSRLTLTY